MLQSCGADFDKTGKKRFCLVSQINSWLECEYCQILNETFLTYELLFSVYGREVFFHLIMLLTSGGRVLPWSVLYVVLT